MYDVSLSVIPKWSVAISPTLAILRNALLRPPPILVARLTPILPESKLWSGRGTIFPLYTRVPSSLLVELGCFS